MLAPEEVYKSAGLVKGESELTPEERKRRRAQKKRKRKGLTCHLNVLYFSMCIRSQDGSSWSLTISFIIPTWKIAFTLFVITRTLFQLPFLFFAMRTNIN